MKPMRWIVFILLVIGIAFASLAARPADTPDWPIHAGPVYTRGADPGPYPEYPEIQIQVDVPPTAGPEFLKPEAFHLRVDSGTSINASRVQTLASTDYGAAVVVSLDVSGSMRGAPLKAVRAGLSKFVDDAGPQDKVAIQTIADDSRWGANWGDSRDQVRASLEKLAARGTLTRLWDSVLEALQRFPASPICRHLTVISDGHDEGSSHTEDDVIVAAREHGVLVDAIGITRSNPLYLQELALLAKRSGGVFREAKNAKELEQLVGSGIQRLKSTPVVSFRLANQLGDGNSHRFEVTWKHEGIESSGDVTTSIPKVSALRSIRRIWLASGASLLLLLVIAIMIARQRNRQGRVDTAVNAAPMNQELAPQTISDPIGRPTGLERQARAAGPLKPRKVAIPSEEPAHRSRSKTEILVRFRIPAKGRPAAWLYCEEGVTAGKRFALDEVEYWIGALENNHLQLSDDPTVSGNHACLIFDHDVLRIYDHESTNGTRVNGELVRGTRQVLRPGDRIRIGQSTFAIQPADREGPGA